MNEARWPVQCVVMHSRVGDAEDAVYVCNLTNDDADAHVEADHAGKVDELHGVEEALGAGAAAGGTGGLGDVRNHRHQDLDERWNGPGGGEGGE